MRDERKDITNPIKAIRAKCIDCCCNNQNEVSLCTAKDCPLWHFRSGHNPYRTKRELTEDQRKAAAERLAKMRAKKSAK